MVDIRRMNILLHERGDGEHVLDTVIIIFNRSAPGILHYLEVLNY